MEGVRGAGECRWDDTDDDGAVILFCLFIFVF